MRCALAGVVVLVLGGSQCLAADCPPNSNDPRCKQEAQQRAIQQQQQQRALQQQQQQQQQRAQQQQHPQQPQQQQQRAQPQQQPQQQQQRAQPQQQQQQQQLQQQQQRAQQEAQQRAQQQRAQQEAQQRAQSQQQRSQQDARRPQPEQPQQRNQQAQPAPQHRPTQQGQIPQKTQQGQSPQPPQAAPRVQQGQSPPQQPTQRAQQGQLTQQQKVQQALQPSAPRTTTAPTPPTQRSTTTTAPGTTMQRSATTTAPPTTMQRSTTTAAPTPTTQRSTTTIAPPLPKTSTAAATAPRVPISATTSVVPRADKTGFAIHHQQKDGSQVVMSQRKLTTGAVQTVAYKEAADRRLGTSTRLYATGHNVVVGKDFHSHSFQGGPTYVTYNTGLRAAMLSSGKPVYRETFTVVRGPDGIGHRAIQKTVYVNYVYGRPVILARPVVRVYEETIIYGRPLYYYRPVVYEPVFYRPFWVPLSAPIVVRDECDVCPGRMAAFATPVARYDDPIDLLGDLQVSSAFEDGAIRAEGGESAALADMRKQMSELTQNVSDRAESDSTLKASLGDTGSMQKMQQTMNELTPVNVPEEVRLQVRAQVRLSIAQHQNQHPAIVSDVASSGYARIFLFQAATPISVPDSVTGEECFLNTGDLISFSKAPTVESPVAQMKVVLGTSQSCQAKQVVDVQVNDLQEMLNAFSERVEDNMKRLNGCISTPSSCVRA